MDKYLYLQKLTENFYSWFDWNILCAKNGYILGNNDRGYILQNMAELDAKLEILWQTKYKLEVGA